MFNVKSRKLVLTLFCSLALVLVLTDGASANTQLDGHRMLRRRSPELLGRQKLGDIIDVGTKGEGDDPNQGNNSPVSSPSPSPVSINLSLSRRVTNDVNVLCLPVAKYSHDTVSFALSHPPDHAHPQSDQ